MDCWNELRELLRDWKGKTETLNSVMSIPVCQVNAPSTYLCHNPRTRAKMCECSSASLQHTHSNTM